MGEMGRCATCRWWQNTATPRWDYARYLERYGWADWRRCKQATWLSHGPEYVMQPPFSARSPLFAAAGPTMTAPDFGCVQWEAKPDG